jgi:Phage integrase family
MGERDVRLGARPADCPVDPHRPQADARPCTRRRPAHREESGNPNQVSADAAGHPYLPERQRGRRTGRCLRRPRRRGTDPGLHRLEIRSADRIERRGRRPRRPTHSCSPVDHPSWRQACRRQPEVCRRQAVRADPQRLAPALKARLDGRPPAAPAIASPRWSLLGLKNWKRAVNWRSAISKICRETLRVHDLRHTYASLSRRAGADLKLLQKAMGHASITVTANTYADLFDDELDNIAVALDSLDDLH